MISNLDPAHFDGELKFVWFPSEEGSAATEGLFQTLTLFGFPVSPYDEVESQVLAVLGKIGVSKFRRHYEIRKLSLVSEPELYELKFLIPLPSGEMCLRLYLTVDDALSMAVGLSFKVKRIGEDSTLTRELQNQDISDALNLARKYFGGPPLTEGES